MMDTGFPDDTLHCEGASIADASPRLFAGCEETRAGAGAQRYSVSFSCRLRCAVVRLYYHDGNPTLQVTDAFHQPDPLSGKSADDQTVLVSHARASKRTWLRNRRLCCRRTIHGGAADGMRVAVDGGEVRTRSRKLSLLLSISKPQITKLLTVPSLRKPVALAEPRCWSWDAERAGGGGVAIDVLVQSHCVRRVGEQAAGQRNSDEDGQDAHGDIAGDGPDWSQG